jgi:hypothetical protein
LIITILAEPRTGSSNFTKWFEGLKNCSLLFLPSDPNSKWFVNDSPKNYKYNTKHLVIKEDYYKGRNYDELIGISDKVILLFRENEKEQIESWINAKKTNIWHGLWVYKKFIDDNEERFFKDLKKDFYKNYLSKDYFKVSYENLYYGSDINLVKSYLDLSDLNNLKWPIGGKYRIDSSTIKEKSLI